MVRLELVEDNFNSFSRQTGIPMNEITISGEKQSDDPAIGFRVGMFAFLTINSRGLIVLLIAWLCLPAKWSRKRTHMPPNVGTVWVYRPIG